jgi:hypothetical protein
MSFLSWAALAIAAFVAAPLIAHLLRRRPPDEQAFAAVKLVPASPAVAQRRVAIEDRALFAIRALAVIALALLGATPFISCSRLSLARPAGASIAITIVLDDSLSMRVPLDPSGNSGGTRFGRAHEAALELVEGLQPGDAVSIVLAGKPARVALATTSNFNAARTVLEKLSQTDRGTDLSGAVHIAGELLRDLRHVDKRVVVLSDLADGESAAGPLMAEETVKLWVPLEELRGAARNCALVRADRSGNKVTVRVACSPGDPGTEAESKEQSERHVEVRAGAKVLVEARLWLDGDSGDMVLTLPEAEVAPSGAHATTQLYAALTGSDAIVHDDIAPVVALGGTLRVGVVSDEPEARVATGGPPPVEQALAALELGVQLQPLAAVPDRSDELDALGLLIVDDVPGFTPAQRRELAAWVEKGGVMLMTFGPRAAAAPLGSGFEPMLPGIVRWRAGAPDGIDPSTDRVFVDARAGLDELGAKGHAQLDLSDDVGLTTLTAWRGGAPFLLEKRMGRGVAYSLTVPFATTQSDFALRPGFLALLLRLADTARSLRGVTRSVVGTPWSLKGFSDVKLSRVTRDDQTVELPLQRAVGGGARRAIPELAGLYELILDANKIYRVAGIDEKEVDLRPREVRVSADADELGGVSAQVNISAYVAIVLLALMLAELLFRMWPGRVRRREETIASG